MPAPTEKTYLQAKELAEYFKVHYEFTMPVRRIRWYMRGSVQMGKGLVVDRAARGPEMYEFIRNNPGLRRAHVYRESAPKLSQARAV